MENKPKQKAIELYHKFYDIQIKPNPLTAIKCALIAVDETIRTLNEDIRDIDVRGNILLDLIEYWEEVKEEIEKIKTR